MTAGMLRRITKLEDVRRAARIIVVSDYGDTDIDAQIAREFGGPANSNDLVVILRKFKDLDPDRYCNEREPPAPPRAS